MTLPVSPRSTPGSMLPSSGGTGAPPSASILNGHEVTVESNSVQPTTTKTGSLWESIKSRFFGSSSNQESSSLEGRATGESSSAPEQELSGWARLKNKVCQFLFSPKEKTDVAQAGAGPELSSEEVQARLEAADQLVNHWSGWISGPDDTQEMMVEIKEQVKENINELRKIPDSRFSWFPGTAGYKQNTLIKKLEALDQKIGALPTAVHKRINKTQSVYRPGSATMNSGPAANRQAAVKRQATQPQNPP